MPLSPPQKPLCHKEARERGKKRVGGVLWGDTFPLFPLSPRCLLYTGTTTQPHWLGYTGTTTNLHIVLNTQNISHQIKPSKEIPVSKISNPKESFDHPCQLKSCRSQNHKKSRMGTSNKQQNTYRSVKGILVNLLHTSLKKTAKKRCRLRIVPNSLRNCASKWVDYWTKWLIPLEVFLLLSAEWHANP